jgi:hypothetical protein
MPTIQRATAQVKELGMPFTSPAFRIAQFFCPPFPSRFSEIKHQTSNIKHRRVRAAFFLFPSSFLICALGAIPFSSEKFRLESFFRGDQKIRALLLDLV